MDVRRGGRAEGWTCGRMDDGRVDGLYGCTGGREGVWTGGTGCMRGRVGVWT